MNSTQNIGFAAVAIGVVAWVLEQLILGQIITAAGGVGDGPGTPALRLLLRLPELSVVAGAVIVVLSLVDD